MTLVYLQLSSFFFNFAVTFEHNQHIDLIFPSGLSQVSSDFMYQFRSSPPEVFLGKGILQICGKFTGEHPCRSVISIKLVIFDTSFFSFAVAIFELLCLCLLFYCHLLFYVLAENHFSCKGRICSHRFCHY